MSDDSLTASDYPVAERRPDLVVGARGKALQELTLEAVVSGEVEMADLRITSDALILQSQIARAAGREALARNFERAAEMTRLPQSLIMDIYEKLRPGRAEGRDSLLALADTLRRDYAAERLATFIEEAAEVYARRRLFSARY